MILLAYYDSDAPFGRRSTRVAVGFFHTGVDEEHGRRLYRVFGYDHVDYADPQRLRQPFLPSKKPDILAKPGTKIRLEQVIKTADAIRTDQQLYFFEDDVATSSGREVEQSINRQKIKQGDLVLMHFYDDHKSPADRTAAGFFTYDWDSGSPMIRLYGNFTPKDFGRARDSNRPAAKTGSVVCSPDHPNQGVYGIERLMSIGDVVRKVCDSPR